MAPQLKPTLGMSGDGWAHISRKLTETYASARTLSRETSDIIRGLPFLPAFIKVFLYVIGKVAPGASKSYLTRLVSQGKKVIFVSK